MGTGAVLGLGALAAWLGAVAVAPPVPANALLATAIVLAAMIVAALLHRGPAAAVAGLTAGVVGSLAVFASLVVLMPRLPDRWVPSIVTVALTPADNVRESRIETVDPYVALLGLGALMLAGLVLALVMRSWPRLRRWMFGPEPAAPVPQVR